MHRHVLLHAPADVSMVLRVAERPEEAGLRGHEPHGPELPFFGVPYLLEALAEAGMEEPGG